MHYIAHRVNTLAALRELPREFGVEIDLRDHGNRLILEHDPFTDGEDFEPYAAEYRHGTMILNVKSERIEHRCLEVLEKHGIKNYFFLDSSFPMINLLARDGNPNSALRFSEFEGLDTIMNMRGRVDWVWVDCFTRLPITPEIRDTLKDAGFKICLVSPELQGRPDDIPTYREQLHEEGIVFDAICTKVHNIETWRERFP